jgi:RNA polymerase sigma factor (sigma-70 family)
VSLVEATRAGDTDAFAELWVRHSAAARRAAGQFRSTADPDDLVAEAYARILASIRGGKGPSGAFRPYLFVTIRNLAARIASSSREEAVEDLDDLGQAAPSAADPTLAALDRSLTVHAFQSLPERWQTVLWYTAVEGMKPAEVGPLLGLSANATAALALRARTALRQAWLQAHVDDESASEECKWMLQRMGRYTHRELSARDRRRAEAHLADCTKCPIISEEIDDIDSRLAIILLPLVLGGTAGLGYLATIRGAGTAPAQALSTANAAVRSGVRWTSGTKLAAAIVITAAVGWGGVAIVKALPADSPHATAPHASSRDDAGRPVPAAPVEAAPDEAIPPTSPAPPPKAPLPVADRAVTAPPTVDAPTVVAPPVVAPPVVAPPVVAPPVVAPPVDVTVPVPTLTAPADGAMLSQARPTVSGTGIANDTVVVRLDATTIGTAIVGADGGWSVTAPEPLADGDYTIAVRQSDGDSSSKTVTRTLTIDTVAAPPTLETVLDPASLTPPSLTGTAEPGATIVVAAEDGTVIGTATADASGTWTTAPLSGLDPADSGFTITQTDRAGNTSPPLAVQSPAFHPSIVAASVATAGVAVDIQLAGWVGTAVEISLDGGADESSDTWTFDADGLQTRQVTFPGPGTYTVGIRYLGADTSSEVVVTVVVVTAP